MQKWCHCGKPISYRAQACGKHRDNSLMRGNKRSWIGDAIGYNGIHRWLAREFGPANRCEECGTTQAKRFEWANITGVYRRVREDFVMLCKSCHVKLDRYHYKLSVSKK